jgi:hypothetical protein
VNGARSCNTSQRAETKLGKRIMRKLVVFNQVTLDGYFTGMNGDISWAHMDNQDAEWNAFVADNANAGGLLLFGRITRRWRDHMRKRITCY